MLLGVPRLQIQSLLILFFAIGWVHGADMDRMGAGPGEDTDTDTTEMDMEIGMDPDSVEDAADFGVELSVESVINSECDAAVVLDSLYYMYRTDSFQPFCNILDGICKGNINYSGKGVAELTLKLLSKPRGTMYGKKILESGGCTATFTRELGQNHQYRIDSDGLRIVKEHCKSAVSENVLLERQKHCHNRESWSFINNWIVLLKQTTVSWKYTPGGGPITGLVGLLADQSNKDNVFLREIHRNRQFTIKNAVGLLTEQMISVSSWGHMGESTHSLPLGMPIDYAKYVKERESWFIRHSAHQPHTKPIIVRFDSSVSNCGTVVYPSNRQVLALGTFSETELPAMKGDMVLYVSEKLFNTFTDPQIAQCTVMADADMLPEVCLGLLRLNNHLTQQFMIAAVLV